MKDENFPTMEIFVDVMKIMKKLGHHLVCSHGFTYDFDADELSLTSHKFNYYITTAKIKEFIDKTD